MEKLTRENYNQLKEKNIVFVDFWAGWCGPCMALAPIYDKVATSFNEKATFMKCNVDEERDIAIKYEIMSIPCILVFKKGSLVDKFVGLANEDILTNFVKKHI